MFEYFCTFCEDIADLRYWTKGEHLCRQCWIKFHSNQPSGQGE